MTGRHYRWHRAWRIDLERARATHECGLVVQFGWARNGGGTVISDESVIERLVQQHGAHNAPLRLARLLREAEEAYAWQQNRR